MGGGGLMLPPLSAANNGTAPVNPKVQASDKIARNRPRAIPIRALRFPSYAVD